MKNRGQVMIFVIVAIILVGSVILFLFVRNEGTPALPTGQEFDAETFVDTCVRDAVRETVDVMMPQGGVYAPTDYALFADNKVAYLCKNVNYYEKCVNQYPMYITNLGGEIKSQIQPKVAACLSTLGAELQNKRYQVSMGEFSINVGLKPGTIEVDILGDVRIAKNDVTQEFTGFSTALKSPLYDLGLVANEIVSQEAQYCYFEYVGFSLLYPAFDVKVSSLSDSTKIYTIKHVGTGNEMTIAIRGCAIPAGF